jgi:outer membrane lipoprotein-sorting protein
MHPTFTSVRASHKCLKLRVKLLLVAGVLLVVRDAGAQSSPPLTAVQVVKNVDAAYAHVTTFSARVTDSYFASAYNQTKASTATLVFAKPNSFDVRLAAGARVTSSGPMLCSYEPASREAFVQTTGDSHYPLALSFLSGLAARFAFAAMRVIDGDYALVGTPISPNASYSTVTFYVDDVSWHVKRVLIIDSKGDRDRFDFTNEVMNPTLPFGSFIIPLPLGTTLVGPPGTNPAAPSCP